MKTNKRKTMKGRREICGFLAPFCLSLDISAGAVVFRRRGPEKGRKIPEYLLLRYPHGHWEFPRGHLEEGETLLEAARRETREETGLEEAVFYPDFRAEMSFLYLARGEELRDRLRARRCLLVRKKVYFFPAEVPFRRVKLSAEHEEFLWLPAEAAKRQLTYDTARGVLEKIDAYLRAKVFAADKDGKKI